MGLARDAKLEDGLVVIFFPCSQDRAGKIGAVDSVWRELGFEAQTAKAGIRRAQSAWDGHIDHIAGIELHPGHVRPDRHHPAAVGLREDQLFGQSTSIAQDPVMVKATTAPELYMLHEN